MRYTKEILPAYDFSAASRLPIEQVVGQSLELLRAQASENQPYFPEPLLPEPGGTKAEINEIEASLGVTLPTDYRLFLGLARYAVVDDGLQIWGLDHNGVSYGEGLWVSDEHHPDQEFLVFGYYWAYADGDQLLLPVNTQAQPVVLYLHEHGPKLELFAPSFSLALWRLTH